MYFFESTPAVDIWDNSSKTPNFFPDSQLFFLFLEQTDDDGDVIHSEEKCYSSCASQTRECC